jgi:hypothetical protein
MGAETSTELSARELALLERYRRTTLEQEQNNYLAWFMVGAVLPMTLHLGGFDPAIHLYLALAFYLCVLSFFVQRLACARLLTLKLDAQLTTARAAAATTVGSLVELTAEPRL